MISDLILNIIAFYLYNQHKEQSKLWSKFFLFMGLSAFVGGLYHGIPYIGEQFRFLSWTLFSTSLIYAQLATYQGVRNNFIKILFIFKSIVLLSLSIIYVNFEFMIVDTALSMLGFIVIGNLLFIIPLSNYIIYGVLISLISVFFIIYKINFYEQYLTYIDIGHYISIISLIVISIGTREDYTKHIEKVRKSIQT